MDNESIFNNEFDKIVPQRSIDIYINYIIYVNRKYFDSYDNMGMEYDEDDYDDDDYDDEYYNSEDNEDDDVNNGC